MDAESDLHSPPAFQGRIGDVILVMGDVCNKARQMQLLHFFVWRVGLVWTKQCTGRQRVNTQLLTAAIFLQCLPLPALNSTSLQRRGPSSPTYHFPLSKRLSDATAELYSTSSLSFCAYEISLAETVLGPRDFRIKLQVITPIESAQFNFSSFSDVGSRYHRCLFVKCGALAYSCSIIWGAKVQTQPLSIFAYIRVRMPFLGVLIGLEPSDFFRAYNSTLPQ